MKKASEYRRRAEESRRQAETVPSKEERELLLDMAARWTALAEEREKLIREYPKLFNDENSS